ncbi:MAG: NrfD/PsrC family molybdoenzyme membrane anchor subunit [Longimicrobiales bacterium]
MRERRDYDGVPPVKRAPFDAQYIPPYFWIGGIAAGSWLVATLESVGRADRDVIRSARYISLGSLLLGTGMLILDLGRPERFLNMLRIVRPGSPMSLGSWALAGFGAPAGLATLIQLAEDGAFGRRAALVARSRAATARAVHLAGLPAALFVSSYTGSLLATTSNPSWAVRSRTLPALFAASAVSSGIAAVSAVLEASGTAPHARQRLARAQLLALTAEIALHLADERRAGRLPSAAAAPATLRVARLATLLGGMVAPLALAASASRSPRRRHQGRAAAQDGATSCPDRSRATALAAGLTLAGSLALRFLTVHEGDRSAREPADTWAYAAGATSGKPLRSAAGQPALRQENGGRSRVRAPWHRRAVE